MTQFKVENTLTHKIIILTSCVITLGFVLLLNNKIKINLVCLSVFIYILLKELLPKVIVNKDVIKYQTPFILYKKLNLDSIKEIKTIQRETHTDSSGIHGGEVYKLIKISGIKNNKTFKFSINYNCKNVDKLMRLLKSQYGVKLVVHK